MIFREMELLFHGSKERLKRNVTKQGGTFPAPGQFRMLWRSSYFKWGLSYRMTAHYETEGQGIRIRYRFLPTALTLFWTALPVVFLLSFAAWELRDGNTESAAAVSLFSLMYPTVSVWQYLSCRKMMLTFFSIVTK